MINTDIIKSISSEKGLIDFIMKNHSDMNSTIWNIVATNKFFSENVLKEVSSVANWEYFCMFYPIPEKLLIANEKQLFWYHVSLFQPLSLKYIQSHKDLLCLEPLTRNSELSTEAKELAFKMLKENNTAKTQKYTDKQLHKTMFYNGSFLSKPKTSTTNDYSTIRKPELKRILDERGIAYNSGDPVALLRQMCMESEPKFGVYDHAINI